MKNTIKNNNRRGGAAVYGVAAVGIAAALALIIFGLPTGVRDFLSKMRGTSGLASISAFGDFEVSSTGEAMSIDEVAETMVADLSAVQSMAKESKNELKNGLCFKNPSASSDFYNVVSGIEDGSDACDIGARASIEAVISLPTDVVFADPASGASKYVVFNKDGSITSTRDILVRISSPEGVRIITVTPTGKITYSEPASNSSTSLRSTTGASGGTSTSRTTVLIQDPAVTNQINTLRTVASGMADVLDSLAKLTAKNNASSNVYVAPTSNNSNSANYSAPTSGNSNSANYSVPTSSNSNSNANYSAPTSNNNSSANYNVPTSGTNTGSSYVAPTSTSNSTSANYTATTSNSVSSESLSVPQSLSLSLSGGGVNLVWNAVPNVSGYKVYKGVSSGGPKSLIATTSHATFVDTQAVIGAQCYAVSSLSGSSESKLSDERCIVLSSLLSTYSAPVSTTSSYTASTTSVYSATTNGQSSYSANTSTDNSSTYIAPTSGTNSSNSYLAPTTSTTSVQSSYIVPTSGNNNSTNSYDVPTTANSYTIPTSSTTNSYTIPTTSSNSYVIPTSNSYTIPTN